jgi:hypothetical protein
MTKPPSTTRSTLLDEALPVYEFSDVNTIVVHASPQSIMRAYAAVTLGEMTLLRPLFALRELPARLTRHEPIADMPLDEPFSRWALAPGSPWIQLGEEPFEEVMGAIGNFAQSNIEFVDVSGPEEFKSFDDPVYSKTVLGIRVTPGGNPVSGYTLVAESRTHVPDPKLCCRFGRYWRIIRPFEAMMVRGALAATKRRAEGIPEPQHDRHTLRILATAAGMSVVTSMLLHRAQHARRDAPRSGLQKAFSVQPRTRRAGMARPRVTRDRSLFRTMTAFVLINNFNGLPAGRRVRRISRRG